MMGVVLLFCTTWTQSLKEDTLLVVSCKVPTVVFME